MRRRSIFPTHDGYKILREVEVTYGLTPTNIRIHSQVPTARCNKAIQELLKHDLLTPNHIIDKHEEQLKLTDKGRRVLRLIEDWHRQSWWKRRRSTPPIINIT